MKSFKGFIAIVVHITILSYSKSIQHASKALYFKYAVTWKCWRVWRCLLMCLDASQAALALAEMGRPFASTPHFQGFGGWV